MHNPFIVHLSFLIYDNISRWTYLFFPLLFFWGVSKLHPRSALHHETGHRKSRAILILSSACFLHWSWLKRVIIMVHLSSWWFIDSLKETLNQLHNQRSHSGHYNDCSACGNNSICLGSGWVLSSKLTPVMSWGVMWVGLANSKQMVLNFKDIHIYQTKRSSWLHCVESTWSPMNYISHRFHHFYPQIKQHFKWLYLQSH